MKEVACAVCGAVYRFAPAEIPPAGKTLTCAKCKARVVVPGSGGSPAMAGGAGDVIDLADLPAPKRVPAPGAAARDRHSDGIDLPMPSLSTSDLGLDLPAPKGPPRGQSDPLTLDSIDLLAPVGPKATRAGLGGPSGPPASFGPPAIEPIDLPMVRGPGITDLPMPKRPSGPADVTDLPTPKHSSGPGQPLDLPDLPAPKRAATPPITPPAKGKAPAPPALFDDLPAPKGPAIGDLPAPKRPSGPADVSDLPVPKRPSGPADVSDLLAPVGPTSRADLPAPKGYFADLPQPKSATASTSAQDVAPKGYFADLPQSKGPGQGQGPAADGVAPKGYFDDLPAPRHANAPAGPSGIPPLSSPVARTPTLDLDGLDLAPPSMGGLELEPNVASARQASATNAPPRGAPGTTPPPLELGGDGDGLAGLDLPLPTATAGAGAAAAANRGGVVSFKPSSGAGPETTRAGGGGGGHGDIDLAVPSRRDTPVPGAVKVAREDKKVERGPRISPKLQRILLGAIVLVLALGAGGYFYFQRYQAQQQRAADIRASLDVARRAMADGNKNSWQRAANAARQVIALDKRNAEALGLAAQALLAAYIDEGTQREARLAEAQNLLAAVPAGAGRTPAVDRAIALDLIVGGDADAAIARLQPLAARKDGDAILFLGWAQLAGERWDEAIASFQASVAATPKRVVPAKYGLARAQLGKGERAAARASFLEVIAVDKDHVGALVGEAEAMPSNEFMKQDATLGAILQRKGIENADLRAVARAWTLSGDTARRSGRIDQARERYRKALAIMPTATDTLVSSAALELRESRLEDAATLIDKALSLAPGDVAANLVAAELDIKRSRLTEAGQRLASLRTRTPPLAGGALGRLHLLDGMRLDADNKADAALTSYEEAGKVLGEDEVEPAIAQAMLLGRMAKAARDANDIAKATGFEGRATERLGKLSAAAEGDPQLAVTLGVAYLAAGSPAESERWLRKAVARRPSDVEANFQLAEALRRQNKHDQALATLVKAFELDPTRIDLGVELARGFEAAGRDAEASALYKRLVDVPTVTLDVRVRAGRFFARSGDNDAGRKQGEAILGIEAGNAAGLFLRAEGLLADGHADDARRLYQQAVDTEADPQYLDGLGRACEEAATKTGDTARRDEALRAYILASDRDPRMLNPRLGRGRLHMARNEHSKALGAFQEALALAPANPDIPYGIGMSFAELGERGKAIEWLNKAVKLKERADAFYRLGDIYFEQDNASAAAGALTRATKLALDEERDRGVTVPWLTQAYWLLGEAEHFRANTAGACRARRLYLERNPTDRIQSDEVRRAMLGCR